MKSQTQSPYFKALWSSQRRRLLGNPRWWSSILKKIQIFSLSKKPLNHDPRQALQNCREENPDNSKNLTIFLKKCSKARSMSKKNTSTILNKFGKHLKLSKKWDRKKTFSDPKITAVKGSQSLLRKAMIRFSPLRRVMNLWNLFRRAWNLPLLSTLSKWPDTAIVKLKCRWSLTWHILIVKMAMHLTPLKRTWQIRELRKNSIANIHKSQVHPGQ